MYNNREIVMSARPRETSFSSARDSTVLSAYFDDSEDEWDDEQAQEEEGAWSRLKKRTKQTIDQLQFASHVRPKLMQLQKYIVGPQGTCNEQTAIKTFLDLYHLYLTQQDNELFAGVGDFFVEQGCFDETENLVRATIESQSLNALLPAVLMCRWRQARENLEKPTDLDLFNALDHYDYGTEGYDAYAEVAALYSAFSQLSTVSDAARHITVSRSCARIQNYNDYVSDPTFQGSPDWGDYAEDFGLLRATLALKDKPIDENLLQPHIRELLAQPCVDRAFKHAIRFDSSVDAGMTVSGGSVPAQMTQLVLQTFVSLNSANRELVALNKQLLQRVAQLHALQQSCEKTLTQGGANADPSYHSWRELMGDLACMSKQFATLAAAMLAQPQATRQKPAPPPAKSKPVMKRQGSMLFPPQKLDKPAPPPKPLILKN
jgi:hypothetical protein